MSTSPSHPSLGVAGARAFWPEGDGCYSEDDFFVEPGAGVAVLAEGCGAIGAQGCPGSKLAVWSVVGERLTMHPGEPAEQVVRRGLLRADESIARLTATWPTELAWP